MWCAARGRRSQDVGCGACGELVNWGGLSAGVGGLNRWICLFMEESVLRLSVLRVVWLGVEW